MQYVRLLLMYPPPRGHARLKVLSDGRDGEESSVVASNMQECISTLDDVQTDMVRLNEFQRRLRSRYNCVDGWMGVDIYIYIERGSSLLIAMTTVYCEKALHISKHVIVKCVAYLNEVDIYIYMLIYICICILFSSPSVFATSFKYAKHVIISYLLIRNVFCQCTVVLSWFDNDDPRYLYIKIYK